MVALERSAVPVIQNKQFYILLLLMLALQPTMGFSLLGDFLPFRLSLLSFLHPLIPIVWISSSTSSIQLILGRPLILLPTGFHSNILLGILPPPNRFTCPLIALFAVGIQLHVNPV